MIRKHEHRLKHKSHLLGPAVIPIAIKGKVSILVTIHTSIPCRQIWKGCTMFIDWQDKLKRIGTRVALFDIPIAMHCHHYNINLQKMHEDILGQEGIRLIYNAAEESNHAAFKIMLEEYQRIRSDKSKLEFAASIYQHCGLGVINFQDVGRMAAGGVLLHPNLIEEICEWMKTRLW